MAVKLLHSTSKEHQEELRREAAILRRLRHPNIVNFLGLGCNGSDQVPSCGRPLLVILPFCLVCLHYFSLSQPSGCGFGVMVSSAFRILNQIFRVSRFLI